VYSAAKARIFTRESATLDLPQGRVQVTPGTRLEVGKPFMNVDVARLLDQEFSRQHKPAP